MQINRKKLNRTESAVTQSVKISLMKSYGSKGDELRNLHTY